MDALRWTAYGFAFFLALALGEDSEDGVPPSITTELQKEYIFKSDDKITLPCKATGNPPPTLTWYKDGQPIDTTQPNLAVSTDPEDGSLTLDPATALDPGFYQCRATNPWGTSISREARLYRAFMGHFTPGETKHYSAAEGTNLILQCAEGRSEPKPTFSWSLARDITDSGPRPLPTNKRILIDDSGNLYFSHVTAEDAQDGKLYKCNTFNNYLDITTGGSYSTIEVTPNPEAEDTSPELLYSTPGPVTAIKGEKLKLKCIFGGRPEPQISWSKGDVSETSDRWMLADHNTKLVVQDVRESDAGEYTCTANNGVDPTREAIIDVVVESRPQFREMISNTVVSPGSDHDFVCTADADPAPETNWLINGEPVVTGDRREISSDGSTLTISDVCRKCPDGASDVMVVQCNISNPNGYAFADASVNVVGE